MIQLKDVISYYIGARISATPFGGQPNRWINGTLNSSSMHGLVDIKFDDWLSPHTLQVDKTKPILRRTEDITDEECISINKISPLFVAGTSEKYINDRLYTIREYAIHQRHRPEVFHFLIKQSFDVFGLIESGQAIDAKTIS